MLRPACLAALAAVVSASPAGVPPAAADVADGRLTVTVVVDRDGSGDYERDVDAYQAGVKITVADAGGQTVSGLTDESGQFVLEPTSELTGGRYFVTAELAGELDLVPAPPSEGFAPHSSTADLANSSWSVVLGVLPRPPAQPELTEPVNPPPPAQQRVAAAPVRRSAVVTSPRFAVGDRVWQDSDGDGRQDDGEPGLAGVSVQLLDAAGTVVGSTTSDGKGRYLFDGLPAGRYSVRFAGLRSGSKLSPAGADGAGANSDPDYTGVTPPFALGRDAPEVRPTNEHDDLRADFLHPGVDAGVAPLRFAIASAVWQDDDADGLIDEAEPPARARVVLLRGRRGEQVAASTATDDEGRYRFTGLEEGTYRVRFVGLGTHRRLTRPRAGINRAVDSSPDPATATSDPVELAQGSADLVPGADVDIPADFVLVGLNAGTVGSYTIANRVWRDVNEDGVMGRGEPGVGGVRVELLDAGGGVLAATTTAASGRYSFTQLPAGQYRLRFPALPAGLHFTTPRAGVGAEADSDVYGNALTAPIAVGEGNPVETRVAAGLSTSAGAAGDTVAPASALAVASASASPSAAGSGIPGPQAALTADEETGGGLPMTALVLLGMVLAAAGAAAVVYARLRRTG